MKRACNKGVVKYKVHGGVPVSTGMLKHGKRVAVSAALKSSILNLNANNNLAYAA